MKTLPEKTAVQCGTPEEARKVLDVLGIHSKHKYWGEFMKGHDIYGDQYCIADDNGLGIGSVESHKQDGYTIIHAAQFLSEHQPEFTPKRGDWVEVQVNDLDVWVERIFLEKEGNFFKCVCVQDEEEFKRGDAFETFSWQQMRQIQKIEKEPIPLTEEFIKNSGIPIESPPAWVFKTDEELKELYSQYERSGKCFDDFLASKRFSLTTADGVLITNPEQLVWWNSGTKPVSQKASKLKEWGYNCFSTEEAAESHLRKTAKVICLQDLEGGIPDSTYYALEKLVNQRINGK